MAPSKVEKSKIQKIEKKAYKVVYGFLGVPQGVWGMLGVVPGGFVQVRPLSGHFLAKIGVFGGTLEMTHFKLE